MSRYYLDIINTEETENARKKAAAAISGDRRRAAIKRIVAEKLKGQYITKRIEPNLLAMFPGAVRCYMSQRNQLQQPRNDHPLPDRQPPH